MIDTTTLSRRRLAGLSGTGVAAALIGLRAVSAQEATPDTTTPVAANASLAGIAGGGTLRGINGEVAFSLAVFTTTGGDGEPVVQGTFQLEDQTEPLIPITIASLRFDVLEQLSEGSPSGRRIVGWATVNGAGEYPFLLQVEDLGVPGSGEDTFNLVLGADAEPFVSAAEASSCDCGGFSYGLLSSVITGDLAVFAVDDR